MLRRIKPDQVKRGMFIHAFEGGWFSHPFWRSKFLLDDDADVAKVRASAVDAVLIDDARGAGLAERSPVAAGFAKIGLPAMPTLAPIARTPLRGWTGASIADPLAEERRQATKVVNQSKRVMRQVFDGVRLGKAVRCTDVTLVVDEISTSLDRNRAMLIGITRLKSKHEYTYLHSVAVCALMVNLAREIGLDDDTTRLMGLAGLLHDIGKMTVDDAILNKPGRLTDDEFDEIRHHAVRGHALLEAGENVPDEALDVCLHHHEKIDGTGYPFGLVGDQISLAARMGAICDVYDAITSTRAYKEAWSPVAAITAMDEWAGHFDEALLFKFMRSIGVYPVGMLVRLRSNQLAIVMDNGRRASRPKLRAFYAIADRELVPPQDVILADTLAGDQVIAREDPAQWGFGDWAMMREQLLAGREFSTTAGDD